MHALFLLLCSHQGPTPLPAPEGLLGSPLAYVEVLRPHAWLRALRELDLGLPAAAADRIWGELEPGLADLETAVGPLEPLMDALAGERAALALAQTNGGSPFVSAVLEGPDPAAARAAIDGALAHLGSRFGAPNASRPVHPSLAGATWWQIPDAGWLVQRAGRTYWAPTEQPLKEYLHADAVEPRGRSEGAPLVAFADLTRWRSAVGDNAFRDWDLLARQPEGLLVLGAGLVGFMGARTLELSAERGAQSWSLELVGRGNSDPLGALRPDEAARPRQFLHSEQNLASALFYRDVGRITVDRQRYLPAQAAAKMASKLRELEIFFGGLRLDEEVLARLSPWLQIAVREVHLPTGEGPALILPAAVLVVDTAADDRLAHALESAFQGLVALSNVEARQAGRSRSFVLRTERVGSVSYSVAVPPPLAPAEEGDLFYNLKPALAVTDGCLVLASHAALLVDVLDELLPVAAPSAKELPREFVHVSGPALARWAAPQEATLDLLLSLIVPDGPTVAEWMRWLGGGSLSLELEYAPGQLHLRGSVGALESGR